MRISVFLKCLFCYNIYIFHRDEWGPSGYGGRKVLRDRLIHCCFGYFHMICWQKLKSIISPSEKPLTRTLLLFSETRGWEWELVAQTGKWEKHCPVVVKKLVKKQAVFAPCVWARTSILEEIEKALQACFWIHTWFTRADVFLLFFSSLQNEAPLFSQDGHKFFFTRAIPQGGRGKFFHISMSTSMVRN